MLWRRQPDREPVRVRAREGKAYKRQPRRDGKINSKPSTNVATIMYTGIDRMREIVRVSGMPVDASSCSKISCGMKNDSTNVMTNMGWAM